LHNTEIKTALGVDNLQLSRVTTTWVAGRLDSGHRSVLFDPNKVQSFGKFLTLF
jgi:hypothetical protein